MEGDHVMATRANRDGECHSDRVNSEFFVLVDASKNSECRSENLRRQFLAGGLSGLPGGFTGRLA